MAYLKLKDRAYSSLAAELPAETTSTFDVATGEGVRFPTTNFVVTIENEQILISSRTNDTLTISERGYGTTDPATHSANKAVELRLISKHLEEIEDAIDSRVISPASNTADYIPLWNGANSKTLKDGLAVPAGGLAGLTALGLKLDASAFSDTGVTGKLITGFTSGAGAVVGTDTILQAINKLDGNIGTKAPSTSPTFATSINGSYLTASEILGTDASKNIISLPVASYPSLTEIAYVKGVTSAIQTQLNAKGTGNGDMLLGTVQSVTAEKKFTNSKLTILGSSTGKNIFTMANASATDYTTTFPAVTGTVALGTGTANEIAYWTATNTLGTLAVATYPSLTELSYIKGLTSAIQTQLNGKQASGSYEVTTNKATTFVTSNDTLYPSVKAVKDYADSLVVGLLDYRGAFNASVNAYPSTGGSGTAGAILKGDMWIISVAGTMGTAVVQIGDSVIANEDTPGQTDSKWNVLNGNVSYVPENVSNKVTSISAASTDTQYGSAKLLYDQLALKAPLTSPTFATSINGSYLTASKILITDASKNIVSAPEATYPSLTELSYIKGLTSAIQTQLGNKANSASPSFTGTVTIGDNCRVNLTLPTADTYCTGNVTDSFASGYTASAGDLVFMGSSSKWLEVDADAVATCKGLIGLTLEAKNDTEAMKVALPGSFVRFDAWNWTVGATLYAGETLGSMQETIPTGADAIIKVVGFAVSADVIFFNPSPDQQSTLA